MEDKKSSSLHFPWPGDLIALVGQEIIEGMQCYGAWQEVPKQAIAGIVDTVRTRILRFALEIGDEFPEIRETTSDPTPLPQERVRQVYNMIILGNVGNIGNIKGDLIQSGQIAVQAGDIEFLKNILKELGLGNEDITDLEKALSNDQKKAIRKRIGPKTSSWLGDMISKASSGMINLTTTVAGNVLTKLISQYLGLL